MMTGIVWRKIIKLNKQATCEYLQQIVVGVDPRSLLKSCGSGHEVNALRCNICSSGFLDNRDVLKQADGTRICVYAQLYLQVFRFVFHFVHFRV